MTQNNTAPKGISDVAKEHGVKLDYVRHSDGYVTATITPLYDDVRTEKRLRELLPTGEHTIENRPSVFGPSQTKEVIRFRCKFPTFDAAQEACAPEISRLANYHIEASVILDQIELLELAEYHAQRIVDEQSCLSIPSTSELVTYNLRLNLEYHIRRFHVIANVLGEETAQRTFDRANETGARA